MLRVNSSWVFLRLTTRQQDGIITFHMNEFSWVVKLRNYNTEFFLALKLLKKKITVKDWKGLFGLETLTALCESYLRVGTASIHG